jgi:hypothetical protein
MRGQEVIKVSKDDLLAARADVENLVVSLDQIGVVFGHTKDVLHDPKQRHALREALVAYLTPTLVQAINGARKRLSQFFPDEEAEMLSAKIAYWGYAGGVHPRPHAGAGHRGIWPARGETHRSHLRFRAFFTGRVSASAQLSLNSHQESFAAAANDRRRRRALWPGPRKTVSGNWLG